MSVDFIDLFQSVHCFLDFSESLPDLVGEDENKLSFFVKSPNADKKTHKNGINQ